jgi:DNA polymerase-3 subunit alpha
LFGDLKQVMEIPTPKIAVCEPWSLTEKLSHEKEVTGMFMSGHPLDNYKFELKYYGILNISDFNEIKDNTAVAQNNTGKSFRIAGLVVAAQHRVTKTGRNFGILTIEDFSGKTELALWSDDYVKFVNYLELGKNLLITGFFKQSWKGDAFEFKVTGINLLESAKQSLTKGIELNIQPISVSSEMVTFIEKNIKKNPGKASLKFNIHEPSENLKITLYNNEKGFTMNEDFAEFLLNNPDIEVVVNLH